MRCRPYYLIDNHVEFYYEEHYLISRDKLQSINLQVPASQCLHELLLNQGNIVSQSDLIIAGWGKRSEQISANTYYQSILHLRRNLELIGLDKGFIKTVNRKGLLIHKEWSIAICTEDIDNSGVSNQGVIIRYYNSIKNIINRFGLIHASFAMIIISIAIMHLANPKPALSKYNLLSGGNIPVACVIYTNSNADFDEQLNILKKLPTLCGEYPVLYLSSNTLIKKKSIIACNNKLGTDSVTKCKTFYYPEYNK